MVGWEELEARRLDSSVDGWEELEVRRLDWIRGLFFCSFLPSFFPVERSYFFFLYSFFFLFSFFFLSLSGACAEVGVAVRLKP